MTWKDAWSLIKPLALEGLRFYAPQIKIPADLIGQATKYFGRGKKGVKKVRKRIGQIDDMIDDMERKLSELRAEREEWVLHWGDLTALLEHISEFKNRTKGLR